MFDYLLVGESGFAHTVDGQVTGWDPESLPPAWEWQYLPAAYGTLADYYLDYDGSKLHFLVDVSTTGEAPLAASCRLRLSFYAAWGLLQWVVELAVDGSLDAWVNGVPGDVPALGLSGAYGFAASPANALPHDLFEVSVAVPPGGFALMAAVPQAGVACEPAETDPVAVVGELLGDGGLLLATDSEVPWIVSAMPPGAMPGDAVEVKGVAFGAETGIAHVGGKEAAVSSWAPGAAMLLVPDAADSSGLRLTTAGGKETNVMPFTVLSPP
jgi:hypothetical protein